MSWVMTAARGSRTGCASTTPTGSGERRCSTSSRPGTSSSHADTDLALAYYHWFFLAQPHDLPERLIASDPEHWIRYHLKAWSRRDGFDADAVREYVRCFDAESIRASCDDYRAAPTFDLADDRADAGRRLTMPLLVLYGSRGFVGTKYDVDVVWRAYAQNVRTVGVDCGHFLPEEAPQPTLAALREFLGQRTSA